MMETEYSITKYNLGTATTAITVPYLSYALESFPLTVSSITAGTGAGSIQFSSLKAATRATGWDNTGYMPSDVTNMLGALSANNSAYTIDRFWIIDPVNYTTKPAVTLSFTYLNAEAAANGSNTITLSNLLAQRWNTTLGTWVDYYPQGTNATGGTSGTVTNVVVPAADFFRSWTLNDKTQPLPIELTAFSGTCSGSKIDLNWRTATETNSSFFTLAESSDGLNFHTIATIPAAGNSSQVKQYHYADDNSSGTISYYKLTETDLNGQQSVYTPIGVEPCGSQQTESMNIVKTGYGISLHVFSLTDQAVSLEVYEVSGRLVCTSRHSANSGENTFQITPYLADGVYLFRLKTNTKSLVQRMPVLNGY
jgi:hypothetical protein